MNLFSEKIESDVWPIACGNDLDMLHGYFSYFCLKISVVYLSG